MPGAEYRREDVLRMVDVTERQLRAWERQGLIPAGETFGFSSLLALKTLKRLRELNIRTPQIRLAMDALKQRFDHGDVEFPCSDSALRPKDGRLPYISPAAAWIP